MYGRLIILLLAISLHTATTFSQCVPDPVITQNIPGVYPDSATGLPHAYVGIPYNTVMHVYVPVDTTYLSLPATIDSIKVTGVSGLPSGFTYTCTPSNCVFPGGTNACILLQGSAPGAGMIGVYPLVVLMTVYGKVATIPQTLSETNDNYSIVIESSTGLWSLSNGSFAVKQNSPNPFSRYTVIPVSSRTAGKVNLKISDLLGNIVFNQDREVQKGISNLQVDAQDLKAGVYIYTVSDGKNTVTRRLVVSGKDGF